MQYIWCIMATQRCVFLFLENGNTVLCVSVLWSLATQCSVFLFYGVWQHSAVCFCFMEFVCFQWREDEQCRHWSHRLSSRLMKDLTTVGPRHVFTSWWSSSSLSIYQDHHHHNYDLTTVNHSIYSHVNDHDDDHQHRQHLHQHRYCISAHWDQATYSHLLHTGLEM